MAKFEITWLEDRSDEAVLAEIRRVAALVPDRRLTVDLFDSLVRARMDRSVTSGRGGERAFGMAGGDALAVVGGAVEAGGVLAFQVAHLLDDIDAFGSVERRIEGAGPVWVPGLTAANCDLGAQAI